MRRLTVFIVLILLLAWGVFLQWQYQGFWHERELIEETLHQQAHSVMNALIGGILSHRRIGFYFDAQIQGALQELTKSKDVLGVSIISDDPKLKLSAGKTEHLSITPGSKSGYRRSGSEYCLIEKFKLSPLAEPTGRGMGRGGGRGSRLGGGGPWWLDESETPQSPFDAGGEFTAVLLLDATRANTLIQRAAWSHAFVSAAGTLVLLLVALAWWASVRLVTARGRARVLETEARHLRELSQAAAGLAHETRNPLGLVRGWTQRLAQSEPDDPRREEHAQAVIEECDRITARINQFLAFAKPKKPTLELVDLDELLAELMAIVQPDLEAKHLAFEKESLRGGCRVRADRELLRQVLFNLVQNAVQFSPQGGVIAITLVRPRPGACRLEVADSGPGVPDEHIESLFTPYFTTRPDGTGLGLAIVRQIATLHGWEVRYRKRPEGGSVFTLEGIHD